MEQRLLLAVGPELPASWDSGEAAWQLPQYYNPSGPDSGSDPNSGNGSDGGFFQFEDGNRWSRTATNGSGLQQGDPTTLTWSIVPDGTPIPGFNSEPAADSDLIARLDDIYNESPATPLVDKVWFAHFENMFASWSDETGLDFVYEPVDDGVTFSNSNRGILGTRADIRLGGHPIDGNSRVLAYNFFPNFGEMIIDTNDSFYETLSGNSLRLRNVAAHEVGHGLGFEHVCPTDKTKLMEPFYTGSFDGPQHDDILVGNRAYGDPYEFPRSNDTVDKASDIGLLADGDHTIEKASIDDAADVDYFRFSVGAPKTVDLTLLPVGFIYKSGPQVDGSCGGGTDFNSKEQSDLAFELWTHDGRRMLGEASSQGLGENEVLNDVALPAAGEYLLKVTGADSAAQLYEIDITVAENTSAVQGLVDFDARLFEIGQLVSVTVRDTDLIGTESVNVTMTSQAGDSETVALAEVGGGVFQGAVPLNTSAGMSNNNGALEADSGDTLTVTYVDADDGSGSSSSITDNSLVFGETCSLEDAFDYSACTVFPDFQDIRDTGTEILRNTDNSNVTLSDAALGDFTFSFYGTTYNSLNVNTNGLLTFGGNPGSAANNTNLTSSPTQATIAAFWTDLRTDSVADEVYWEVVGSGDNEQLIIQWNDVVFDDGDNDGVDDRGNGVTFQVILSEHDDSIQINHLDLDGGENVDGSEGALATVGIKDSGSQGDGTNRLLLANNNGPNDFVGSNQSFRISRHPTLLLTIDTTSIREDDGANAATATLTRTRADNSVALTVDLASSDTSEATVAASVTIPANQSSVTFPINAVDDNLLDGTETVTISTTATGFVPSSRDIDVTDHETLTVVVNDIEISENAGNGATTVTLTRSNTDNNSDLAVTLVSSDTSEATVQTSATIPSGQASVTLDLDAVDDALLDGTQTVIVSGSANGYFPVDGNVDVLDYETVILTIAAATVSENDGVSATTATVQRSNTDNSAELIVTLASSDPSEATVPSTVTIPGGSASATLDIDAIDDDLLDGTQTVVISSTAGGYESGSDSLDVSDHETLSITISPAVVSENAGPGATTATITRSNTDNGSALTINLQSDDTTEADVPISVTIPAGDTSTTIDIDAVDDDLLDGTQTVTISSSHSAYQALNDTLQVTDHESLTIVILADSVFESAGVAATSATVTRGNTDIDDPLTVLLGVDDSTEAEVPASVTIPSGENSATFDIDAVDDDLLDGSQMVWITASNASYVSGTDSLDVLDDETLGLTFNDAVVSENAGTAATTGTITRPNVDNTQPLVVNLNNSDASELTVPASVTIPANQSSVTFDIDSVDDSLLDGTQTVTITVSATGFFDGSANLDVADYETLSIVVQDNLLAENAGPSATTATISRSNLDNDDPLVVDLTSDDTTELSLPDTVMIPAGQASVSVDVDAVDDDLLDGTQSVVVSATGDGYVAVLDTVEVTDYETITVTISADSFYEDVGSAATTALIQRSNSDTGLALVVQMSSSDTTEASVPASVTIPANQASVQVDIDAVDDDVLDGTQTVTISAATNGYVGSADTVDVLDREGLSLSIAASQIREDQGADATTATVARPQGGSQAPLLVTLANGDPSEIGIPATVTIPDGQDSVTFSIDAVDDTLLDATQTASIQATADGFAPASASVDVLDFETLSISLTDDQIAEDAGTGATTATITRSNSNNSGELTVQLVNGDPSEVALPASITIPANSSSVTVQIDAVDDQLLDGTQSVLLTPQANGYHELPATLEVTDVESLTITINASHISEDDGPAATTATVSRSNTDNTLALIVDINSSDTSEATAATTVTIAAGENSATFDIDAVDDTVLDGSQSVTFRGEAEGYQSVTDSLVVRDHETLSLVFDVTSFAENDGNDVAIATVTRNNTNIASSLLVSIFNDDTSEVDVPSSVLIPTNQASATFTVHAVDDTLLDGTQSVTIQAATEGYALAGQTLTVTDYETLTVEIAAESVSEDQGQAATTVTVTRSNTDNGAELILSLSSDDTSEATVPAAPTIPANQSSVTVDLDAVDDQILDGPQLVEIRAAAAGYVTILDVVEITDHETLTVILDDDRIAENGGAGATFATVSRSNTDADGEIVVTLTSSDTSEATVPTTLTIPANAQSASFPVNAVDDTLRDGTQTLTISAVASGYSTVSDTLQVTDHETITVEVDAAVIAENDGSDATTLTITRSNTDNSTGLLVLLTSSDTTEASATDRVIIPANETSVSVAVDAVDDALLDGTQAVVFSAAAEGYFAITDSLQVTDHEILTIEIDDQSIVENAGQGATTATVTRSNVDDAQALTVSLTSSDVSEATVPTTMTIPADKTSIVVPIDAVDDSLLDGTQSVTISVSASGFVSAASSIDVLDHETLTLTVSATEISEDAGPAALSGRVTRGNTDQSEALEVSLFSDDATEATVPTSITIPAGAAFVDFDIDAVDDDLLDGNQQVVLSAQVDGYDIIDASLLVLDAESLTVAFAAAEIAENEGSAATEITITRSNSDLDDPLTVTITNGDASELTVPASIEIPSGAVAVTYTVDAVDDNLLDGTQRVSVSAAAGGYSGALAEIDITDHETLALELNSTQINEADGNSATTATVTRSNTDTGAPLTVTLGNDDLSELATPPTVTIPAGMASVTFDIDAVDDSLLDGSQDVTIDVNAGGYVGDAKEIVVTDHETISLTVDLSTITENDGPAAALATVTRSNTDNDSPLLVTLANSDSSEIEIPASITIPAGDASIAFAIDAVDDSLLDGTQTATITATETRYVGDQQHVDVLDHETLTLVFDITEFVENQGPHVATGTVSRSNTDRQEPLTVVITSSDTSELLTPQTVIIPADQSSITFPIDAVDDTLLDGLQLVTVQVSQSGYETDQVEFEVADHETLTINVADSSVRESDGLAATDLTVTRSNTDNGQPITLTLTNSDPSEIAVPTTITIEANQGSATIAIDAVDDTLLDGLQTAIFSVSAGGYLGDSTTLDIEDHEHLSITLDDAAIGEQAGPGAVSGTLSRSNTDQDQPLTVSITNSDVSEVAAPTSITIPAGEATVAFTLDVLDDTLLDGTQTVLLTADESRYDSGQSILDVLDHETLMLLLDANQIQENDGLAAVQGTVTRSNTDIDQPLSVTLVNDDETEASAPQTIVIPAGQASVSFGIDAVDDTLLDGTQTVLLSVSEADYFGDEASLQVADHETLSVVIAQNRVAENDGPAATYATITRSNSDINDALIVSISSSDHSELVTLANVTIDAGQSSVDVSLDAVDDSLLDGIQQVVVSVSSAGYEAESQTVDVTDHETLQLELSVSSLHENDGPAAATATVTRSNTDNDSELVVNLESSDTTELGLPATATIPANESSITFDLDAVDDSLLDGPQSVVISASTPGYFGSQKTAEVLDHEILTLVIDISQVSENAGLDAASATLTRSNTDWDAPLTVQLTNGDASEIDVPTEVTIPTGQLTATFPIHAVDDTLLDGMQAVMIDAEADGYVSAQQSIEVTDYESLALTLDVREVNEHDGTAVAIATLVRGNSDIDQPLVVQLSGDDSEIGMPVSVTIPATVASVQFVIDAVDDTLLDGTQSVVLQPSANGYVSFGDSIDVTDHETLSIEITDTLLRESDGVAARMATITRSNTNTELPLPISIASDDESEIAVPLNVTIAANESSVDVPIDAIDDTLLDGTQEVLITVQANGYEDDQLQLTVLDYETVTLVFADSVIEELDGIGATTGTVTRSNSDNDSELIVLLQGVDLTEVTMPSEVTIPAGQLSTSFSIDAIDDQLIDGVQSMTVTASAEGFQQGIADLEVLDNSIPWQNSRNPLDVNNDGVVAPIDALIVINYLNLIQGSGQLPAPPAAPPPFYDTSGDNVAAPQDALLVINFLNDQSNGEGEAPSSATLTDATDVSRSASEPLPYELCLPAATGKSHQDGEQPERSAFAADNAAPSWIIGPVAGQAESAANQTNWDELLDLLAADTASANEPSVAHDESSDDDVSK